MQYSSVMKSHSQAGITLIETLIALAIYAVLISTLVVVNKSGIDILADLEAKAVARRALQNVVIDFKRSEKPKRVGRYNGQYAMSHFTYHWEIKITRSQNQSTRILQAEISTKDGVDNRLATLRQILTQ